MWPNYFHNADLNELTIYESKTIQEIFHKIVNDYGIEFSFQQGGCQQRAQIISLILEKYFQINHYKVWLFSPAAYDITDNKTIYVEDNRKLSYDNLVNWNYHVAILVQVKKEDETIETTVLDPSISTDNPLPTIQWFNTMTNSSYGKYTFTKADKYFFDCFQGSNGANLIFNGFFTEYTSQEKDNLVVEKGLAINDMAVAMYDKHIHALMQIPNLTNHQKNVLEDLKAIFGNATALDMLFAQNNSAQTFNTTLRYAQAHYNHFIAEARNIFFERLHHWTKFTNTLFSTD